MKQFKHYTPSKEVLDTKIAITNNLLTGKCDTNLTSPFLLQRLSSLTKARIALG